MLLHVNDFGCAADGRFLVRAAINATSAVLTDPDSTFRPTDVGKNIAVPGAVDLVATIAELVDRKDVVDSNGNPCASMTAGSTTLTAQLPAGQRFRPDLHLGLRISVAGAGAAGATLISDVVGEVRIAAPIATAAGFLAGVTDRLARRHPRIVCHLITGELAMLLRALEDRDVDALIAAVPTSLADHLQAEVFYTGSRFVVASTENRWSRRRRVGLADLMNEPWTLPPPDSPHGAWAAADFRAAGLDVPRATVITYTDIARVALVAKGRFLTIAGASAVASFHTTIKALPIELIAHASVGIVTLKNRTLTPVAQLFIDCAREVAKPMAMPRRRQLQKARI